MILLADSGSTKTTWCVVAPSGATQTVTTHGINPFFQGEEEIATLLRTSLLPQLEGVAISAIYFYGAGCAATEQIELLRNLLATHFPQATTVEVESDMVGAARSLCGREAGIVCILGTGSNSCLYNGERIVENVSPLGFILGDEGSGATLGRLWLGNLLKNQTSASLRAKFEACYTLSRNEILESVYRQPFPNRFLASFAPFLRENMEEPEIRQLLLESFTAFFTRNVMQYKYREYPIHCIGSVAFYFEPLLREAATRVGIALGTIKQNPMEGLINYHA